MNRLVDFLKILFVVALLAHMIGTFVALNWDLGKPSIFGPGPSSSDYDAY